MSLETSRWTQLTQEQTAFFSSQIEAVKQVALSPVSQEAGIVPVHAGRFSFQTNPNSVYAAVIWPDPHERNTACMVMGTPNRGSGGSAFARITENEESFAIEGVGTNLTYGAGADIYGKQLILRHDMPDDELSASVVGVNFFASAVEKATNIQRVKNALSSSINPTSYGAKPLASSVRPEIIGIEGDVSGRLFRSLSSFASNLAIAGVMNERVSFGEKTYDLAQVLLKTTIARMVMGQKAEQDALLMGPNGKAIGAVFESEQDGIVMVRRTGDFPDTIALANTTKPTTISEDQIFVEQHFIQARGVGLDVITLPPEAYGPHAVAMGIVQNEKPTEGFEVDEVGVRTVQQRIMRLLNEAESSRT